MGLLGLVIMGGVSYTFLKIDRLPPISIPFVSVQMSYTGATAQDVELLITEPIDAIDVEADDPFPDRLRMAAQFLGDAGRAPPLPATHDHLGAGDPITRCMATTCQFPDLAVLCVIQRCAGEQKLGYGDLL